MPIDILLTHAEGPRSQMSGAYAPIARLLKRPRIQCRPRLVRWIVFLFILGPFAAVSQTTAPGSDPQAVSLASSALAALTGGQTIHDVTLTGSATWGTGGNETGTATLKALGPGESRIDLVLSDGTRTEIRDASTGISEGEWSNPNGTSGLFAAHNVMTDAVWFFPALGSLAGGSGSVLTYVGMETRHGESVQHLRSYTYQAQSSANPTLTNQQLSTMDFYLDAASYLPVAVTFNQHPDDNASVNIPVEIDFSSYQAVSGALVPMHITKVANGATLLDITLSGAVFNSGVPLSEFSISQEGN